MSTESSTNGSAKSLHIARSKFIDGFVEVEEAIVALLMRSSCKFGQEHLGAKIQILRKAKAGPRYSKEKSTAVGVLLDQLEPLMPVRAAIVHGRLSVATIGDETLACFVNARDSQAQAQPALMLTPSSFNRLTQQLHSLAGKLVEP